jgi:hypothetical protein
MGGMCQRLIEEGQGAAVARLQRVEGVLGPAEQVLANAQLHGSGWTAIRVRLEFLDGGAEIAVGSGVTGQSLDKAADLCGTERAVAGDHVTNVEASRWCHGSENLLRYRRAHEQPAAGVEPATPALRMRCSAN